MGENLENQQRLEAFSKSLAEKQEQIQTLETKFQESMDLLNTTSSQLNDTTVSYSLSKV
jgi:peptidoglycan hydrolase CwlO-like protein